MEQEGGLQKESKLTSVGDAYLALQRTDNHFCLDKLLVKKARPITGVSTFFN